MKPNHAAIVHALNLAKKGDIDFGLCDPTKMSAAPANDAEKAHFAGLDHQGDDGTQAHSLPLIYNGKLNADAVEKALGYAKEAGHEDLAAALGHVFDAIDAQKKAQMGLSMDAGDEDDNGDELMAAEGDEESESLDIDGDDAEALDAVVSDNDDLVDDEGENDQITDDTTPPGTANRQSNGLTAGPKTPPARVSLRSMNISKGAKPKVERDGNGAIRNVSVMQAGPALGHGFVIDQQMLGQIASQMKDGAPMRFTHPQEVDESGQVKPTDSLGTHVGRVTNVKLSDGEVRGDIEFGPHAKKVPGMGDVSGYLMDLADSDPSSFGLSTVFEPDDYDVDAMGNPVGRSKGVAACDLTGDPASNRAGLL